MKNEGVKEPDVSTGSDFLHEKPKLLSPGHSFVHFTEDQLDLAKTRLPQLSGPCHCLTLER